MPVTLRVGFGDPVLVISGPNTGGKTVALKTVGLLALMAQCGLHVPAAPGSRLPVFRRIYADIGDDQSIAENLSTFSAHLASIVEMTRDLAAPALVLLDEVGAGTDPTEGGGLGVAIVDHFRAAGAMVVATTHHGLMKAYAQSTPGVGCASFGYDPATYEPTYRLALGVPGRSLALEMAERLGLPAAVVADARSRLSLKEAQAEALLKKLEDAARAAPGRGASGCAWSASSSRPQAAPRARSEPRRTGGTRKTEAEAFARELRKRGEEAARKAADAIREAVAARRVDTPFGRERGRPRPHRGRPADPRGAGRSAPRAAARACPRGRSAGRGARRRRARAREVAGRDRRGDGAPRQPTSSWPWAASGCASRSGELVALGRLAGRARRRTFRRRASAKRAGQPRTAEINIVGLTVDEALPKVDKFLDDAALADRREVRVIHGFGRAGCARPWRGCSRATRTWRRSASARAARAAAGPRSWS